MNKFFFTLLFVLSVTGCGSSVPSQPGISAQKNGLAQEITAEKFLGDYNNNEVAADVQYKGKGLRLSGKVNSLGRDNAGAAEIRLGDGGIVNGFSGWCAICKFDADQESSFIGVKQFDQIVIEGTVEGLQNYSNSSSKYISLSNCRVVKK